MTTSTTAHTNLQRLALVRLIVLTGQIAAIIYAYGWLQTPLHYDRLLGITLLMSVATVVTFWRMGLAWPVTDPEFFAQLLLDVLGLGALLYYSGGATNPFISYLLVPLSIAAAILPSAYTITLAIINIGIYSALLFFYIPLTIFLPDINSKEMQAHIAMGHFPAPGAPTLNAHIFGMWCNFAISSALITYVVARMAATVREQQSELNRRREKSLHNEQLLAVATLAAGTAHELGTPLSTMTVLLDDMHCDGDTNAAELNSDIALLKQQVLTCRSTLKNLVSTAESLQYAQPQTCAFDVALRLLLERWQIMRPNANYVLQLHTLATTTRCPTIAFDETLQQAIINLLNNAADADSGPLAIRAEWDREFISLTIRDHGPGLPLDLIDQLGKAFVTTKGKGLGLGLFLSHATIERCGGDIRLYNHPNGGTEAVLRLPITSAVAEKNA
jgi:two-component system sensor histidine kinase RegB